MALFSRIARWQCPVQLACAVCVGSSVCQLRRVTGQPFISETKPGTWYPELAIYCDVTAQLRRIETYCIVEARLEFIENTGRDLPEGNQN